MWKGNNYSYNVSILTEETDALLMAMYSKDITTELLLHDNASIADNITTSGVEMFSKDNDTMASSMKLNYKCTGKEYGMQQ